MAAMTGLEALQAVQYVTVSGRRLAVVSIDDWEHLIEWLETVEDVGCVREALHALQSAGSDRKLAGWLRWDEAREELE